MDSGASFHSISCRECMYNYTSGMFRKVHLADDETLDVVGQGDVKINTSNDAV